MRNRVGKACASVQLRIGNFAWVIKLCRAGETQIVVRTVSDRRRRQGEQITILFNIAFGVFAWFLHLTILPSKNSFSLFLAYVSENFEPSGIA